MKYLVEPYVIFSFLVSILLNVGLRNTLQSTKAFLVILIERHSNQFKFSSKFANVLIVLRLTR